MTQGPSCPAPRLGTPGKPGSGQPRVATRLKRKDLPGCGASSAKTRAYQAGREGLVTRNSWDRRSWRACSAGRAPGRTGGWLLRGEKGGGSWPSRKPSPPSRKAHRWGQRRSSRPRTGAPFRPRSQAGTSQASDGPRCRPSQQECSEATPKSFSQSCLRFLIASLKANLQNLWPKPHQKKHVLRARHWAGYFALPLTV